MSFYSFVFTLVTAILCKMWWTTRVLISYLDVSQLTYLESGMVKIIVFTVLKEGQNNLDGLVWFADSGFGLLH